ncbi:MAG: hypothetical protein NT123_25255, partial [Proteobacteria bacterium]|nr:hypothetical protein [Pseudomonadota bacterium]
MIRKLVFLVLSLALGLAPAISAEPVPVTPPPAGASAVTSVEGVAEYRLANGLRLLRTPTLGKIK